MRILPVIVISAALAACGGGAVDPTVNTGNCTGSLSGAVSESNINCFAAAATDSNGDGNGAVSIGFTNPAGFSIVAAVLTHGTPTTATYANTDANAQGACEVVQTSNNQVWIASAGGSGPTQGSYSFQVSSLGNEVQNPDGGAGEVFLAVHGSLNCTVPALTASGASGTVNIAAKF